ncbi:MAG: hypothetical protein K8M05_24810 [Deltaproteobacteria bacterium]|nr:hypothetical protein [Kofleriaceae bacterium]
MRGLHPLLALAVAGACANADGSGQADGGTGGDGGGSGGDATSCGDACDEDGDGVPDSADQCPATPDGAVVNQVGCSDGQVSPTLEPDFPPFGLTWTPTGDLGRAGGLTWTYTGIDRADRFHIYWVICDDPATPCGVSLDGPIDVAGEGWQYSTLSAPGAGRVIFDSAPSLRLADGSSVALDGRLVVTLVGADDLPIPFDTVGGLGVPARSATHGAELPGTGFTVSAIIEVRDASGLWAPYLDYYDAAATAEGGTTAVSFGASFYSE